MKDDITTTLSDL